VSDWALGGEAATNLSPRTTNGTIAFAIVTVKPLSTAKTCSEVPPRARSEKFSPATHLDNSACRALRPEVYP
jgi:hypothetical protein